MVTDQIHEMLLPHQSKAEMKFVPVQKLAACEEDSVTRERLESDDGFRYDASFLKRFSISNTCQELPIEFKDFDWDALRQDSERLIRLSYRLNERRSSWPKAIEPPVGWRSGKRASLDEGTLFSHLQAFNSFNPDFFDSRGLGGLPRIWDQDEREGLETKQDSALVQSLAAFEEYFDIRQVSNLSPSEHTILEVERCPLCLNGFVHSLKKVFFVVFSCKLLQCVHVCHADCVSQNVDRINQLLMKHHTTSYFRSIPVNQEWFDNLPNDPPGTRPQCGVTLKIAHILSSQAVMNLSWPHTLSTLVDRKCGKEYLLITLDPHASNCTFNISRGRISFHCKDYSSGDEWTHESNFDISSAAVENIKLALVDTNSQNSLEVGLRRISLPSQFCVTNLKYKFSLRSASKNSYSSVTAKSQPVPFAPRSFAAVGQPLVHGRAAGPSEQNFFPWERNASYSPSMDVELDRKEQEELKGSVSESQEAIPIDTENPPSLQSLVGKLRQVAKSQSGSRFIQEKLDERKKNVYQLIFPELCEGISELMVDNFGHYAVQKLIEVSDEPHKLKIVTALSPSICNVACHKQGSFSLQAMMDNVSDSAQVELLAESLKKNLHRVIMSASGHYVVAKFLQRFPFPYTRFIHECIEKNCGTLACDHYGLRIMKTAIDVGPLSELSGVFKKVARSTMKIVENQYGNYVIQQVLDVAPQSICNNIKMKMEGKFVRLAKQKFSSNVVEKCLQNSNNEWRTIIIRELSSAASKLIRDRYGNYVLQTALQIADPALAREMSDALYPHLDSLRENVKQKWLNILEATAEKHATGGSITGFEE
jgi:hypothetical protein